MITKEKISYELDELADSLAKLADMIESQRQLDKQTSFKQLSLIQQRFEKLVEQLEDNSKPDWKKKYQKGFLRRWMSSKGMVAAQATESLRASEKVEEVAKYLADNFSHLTDFYDKLKYGQSQNKDFLYISPRNSLPHIKKWCELLRQEKFIDAFIVKGDALEVEIANIAEATLFIYGYWLELALRREIVEQLTKHHADVYSFDVLTQVHVSLPDTSTTELDILLMLNDEVYWFECKSGSIGEYYERFAKNRQLMGLDSSKCAVAIPERNASLVSNFKKRCGMQTFFVSDFPMQLSFMFFKK